MSTTAVTTTNQNRAVAKKSDLKAMLDAPAVKDRFREILGQRAPQFAAALLQVTRHSWALSKCEPQSVIGAAMTAAALDLSIDPNLGEAHLVPYSDQCQFQMGYMGFTQLAMRSGQYKTLGWMVVYEGQLKKWNELTGELVVDPDTKTSDTVIGYAAMFTLLNGFERGSYWKAEKVKAHAERYSQAYKKKKGDSPWFTNFDKMALKTVLKELLKTWGPKSIQMQRAILEDQSVRADIDSDPQFPDGQTIDVASEPVMTNNRPAPTLFPAGGGKPAEKPADAKPAGASGDRLPELLGIMQKDGKTEAQVVTALRSSGMVDDSLDDLKTINEMAPSVIAAAIQGWKTLVKAIDAAQQS